MIPLAESSIAEDPNNVNFTAINVFYVYNATALIIDMCELRS
jgi:hypothetical protein